MRFSASRRFRPFRYANFTSSTSADLPVASPDSSEIARSGVYCPLWDTSDSLTDSVRPNSPRAIKFSTLLETIRRMADLPPTHNLHIDRETAKKSEAILALIKDNFEQEAPKIFPQEGEALVLTWDAPDFKRYLTIDGSELDLLDFNKRSKIRCELELSFDHADDIKNWILQLGGVPSSKSDGSTVDAF